MLRPIVRKILYVGLVSLLSLIYSTSFVDSSSKQNVIVSLEARWSTGILQEACDFIASEEPRLFWKFIESVFDEVDDFEEKTEKDIYDIIIRNAHKLLVKSRQLFLTFALSLRHHSPSVEMQKQTGRNSLNLLSDEMASEVEENFVDFNGLLIFSILNLEKELESLDSYLVKKRSNTLFDHDVHYNGSSISKNLPVVILYGDVYTKQIKEFHKILKKYADGPMPKIDYVFRHFTKKSSNRNIKLSGYAVELAIKSTEYKAQDDSKVQQTDGSSATIDEEEETDLNGFNFKVLKNLHPDLKDQLNEFKVHLLESNELSPLKVWQLQDLSFQAGQKLTSISDPHEALQALIEVNQNFPILARSLLKYTVKDEFRNEVEINQARVLDDMNLNPGDSALFINGLVIDLESKDAFQILDLLKSEEKLASGFFRMGFRREYLSLLMSIDSTQDGASYAIDYRNSYPEFINNLDSDQEYKEFGNSVRLIVQPYFPGMIRPIARNFFTLLFDQVGEREIESADIIKLFKKKYPGEDYDIVFGPDSDYDKGRNTGSKFLNESGLGAAPKVLLNGIPLDDNGITADHFEETVINEIMKITPKIQKDVLEGKLTDNHDVAEYLLDQPGVMPRLNGKILKPKDPVHLDLTDVFEYKAENAEEFEKLGNNLAKNQFIVQNMKYAKLNDDVPLRPVTVWVIADWNSSVGLTMSINAIKSLKHTPKTRIGFLPNWSGNKMYKRSDLMRIYKFIYAAMSVLPAHQAKNVITKILSETIFNKILKDPSFKPQDLEVYGVSWTQFERTLEKLSDDFLSIFNKYATDVLAFTPGTNGLVVNGQIIGPLETNEIFTVEDFTLIEKYHLSRFASIVAQQIQSWQVSNENDKSSDLTMRVCSLIATDTTKMKRHWVYIENDKHSVISIPSKDLSQPTFDVLAVVDPLSPDAQRIVPWLQVLLKIVNADLKVMMNCKPKLSEMPLKNFYRFVLQPELEFTDEGTLKAAPFARFSSLPRKQLLTLNVITPDAWMVESKRAVYDLDNIKMDEVHGDVVALFELEHILLEGHCFDDVTGNPPRGLQFTLGTNSQPIMYDTIVMANLGYFQLKANPGTFVLRLREGRSSEIYDITSHENTDSPSRGFTDISVVMNSFSGRIIRIRVTKKPDKLNEHLLMDQKDSEEQQSVWSSLANSFTSQIEEEKAKEINIFSLASGHLYERFMRYICISVLNIEKSHVSIIYRIMMMSVSKHAKLPVKFWLLKNYLSPNFKEFLPTYAKHYNFSYELVQYKWPRWLHRETVKQRIMWGYKILFLDVLFPLDVKKIIFVDADQVVRVNMQELMDLDLDGAPYAYTPFCDSREEMEGYRFWKRGYWSSHLGHRKYHIRGQYQGLSSDANSLSNLDQDLPNNMIHQVKIKSLPQDWLWCETWCSDKSKSYAKTIDLCNNPQTKEPKLESAMRIIGEWRDYDNEIKLLKDQFESSKLSGLSPSVNSDRKPVVESAKTTSGRGDSREEL
uniref:UDP-glucose:glycoprotein glucosyltransferase n=1 Tax=Romanomermis culicivorax TaxID=13658 RepID=A0A915JM16_ROMCU